MSTGDFKAKIVTAPNTNSPSSTPSSNPDANPVLSQSLSPDSQLDRQMLIKDENSSEPGVSSPGFHADLPSQSSQSSSTPPDIGLPTDYTTPTFSFPYGNSRQTNLFLLTPDGNFASLSPHQILDVKELEKMESSGVILSSRPLSNSSLSAGSNASPKPFMALALSENKNDKMISGFDSRVDGLSPLSVIAVSAYQDTGHPSPTMLSRHGHPVLRYPSGGGDTMLSALNYSESDMLQEGGFDVPSSVAFSSLDNLLGTGMEGTSAPGMRLPDLLDGEISQETYMETGQDLQLSPQAFSTGGDNFTVGESTSLSNLTDANDSLIMTAARDVSKVAENNSLLMVDKLKVKNNRPVKATSPSRPGTQPCPTCGKVFSNSSALTKHKLTHSDERKYVCPLCAKAFKRQDHLNGHMLTHRNKKPFECDAEGCGKSYCDARSLRRHKENHHSSQSTLATPLAVTSLGKSVAVIPGLAHLANFNSLQSSFPASVITSSANTSTTDTSVGNRIQYAPPPVTSISAQSSTVSNETVTKAAPNSIVGSIIPTVTSHLQFLTFHQQPATKSSVQTTTTSTVASAASKVDRTVLATWPSQTINTGALLLTQNLDRPQQATKSAQFLAEAFNLSSSTADHGKALPTSLSDSSLLSDVNKSLNFLSEKDSNERPTSKEYLSKCKDITSFSSSPEKLNNHRLNLTVVSCTDTAINSPFSSDTKLNVVQNHENKKRKNSTSSAPTTPIKKEPSVNFQMESPLLQQLLNQQQNIEVNRIPQNYSDLSFLSTLPEQPNSQQSSMSQPSRIQVPQWSQAKATVTNSSITTTTTANRQSNAQDPKPVECSLCQRKFKNVPALNGHMRLHGGYFKKENDGKKGERKTNASSAHHPLTTASTNIRALIEEKIIQKRNFGSHIAPNRVVDNTSPSTSQTFDFPKAEISTPEPSSSFVAPPSPIISSIAQESSGFNDFTVSQNSLSFDLTTTQNNHDLSYEWLKKLDLKHQFRVPRPPAEKHRRHSDSDHFIPAKRPCTSYTNHALTDLLRRKVVAKRTSRTGSDPGEPLSIDDTNGFPDLSTSSLLDFFPKFSTVSSSLRHSFDDAVLHHDGLSTAGEDSILPILSAEDIPDAQPAMTGMKDMTEIDSNCLDKSVFFETSNTDIAVGQPFPEITVSELEMMQLTTVVTSTPTIPLQVEALPNEKIRTGEDSNDDDVFLSPTSLPTSPMKVKRKHRPEPLYIPPYVNTCGFTSRLRSPRLWDPSHPDHKKLSPPPYTPPPMLSPVRSGSGLFWHIISGSGSLTPKSAPITPSFGLNRKGSLGDMAVEEEEESLGDAPETDVLPHVNVGSFYQAKLPYCHSNFKEALFSEHKADEVWQSSTVEHLSDEEVDAFVELACCAVVPGGGRNKEYAHHLLHLHQGKIQDAILALMNPSPKLPVNHALLSYQYSESDKWSPEEIEAYHQGLLKCDKDFFSIAKDIPTKTVKQCVQFYYLWKKVCPDEYKRIRMIRRRKEQESLYYNLRTKGDDEGDKSRTQSPLADVMHRNGPEDMSEHNALANGQVSGQNCTEFPKLPSSGKKTYEAATTVVHHAASAYDFPLDPVEEFPCKICGKVFSKVKSRSAHMKSHRQPDSEKKAKYES